MKLAMLGASLGLVVVNVAACSSGEVPTSAEQLSGAAEGVAEVPASIDARTPGVGRKLMIIGNIDGELVGQNSRDAIFTDRLLADVGGAARLHVLVVPAASSTPAFLGVYLRSLLALRGVAPSQVETAHIANQDDDSTPHVDESTWLNGARH